MKRFTAIIVLTLIVAICLAGCNVDFGGVGGNNANNSSSDSGAPLDGSIDNKPSNGKPTDGDSQEVNSPTNNGPESEDSDGDEGDVASADSEVHFVSNVLVAYFSCTETTKGIAEKIARATGGDLYRIVPAEPYTSADLNYNDNNSRANKEQGDPSARPAIASTTLDISGYDIVFVGYPIWWGRLPKIMYTFFESYDFGGKTIVPFCTSGSSGISASEDEIADLEGSATRLNGRRFAGSATATEVKNWVDGLELKTDKEEVSKVKIYCGKNVLEMELTDNASARAFADKLKSGDVTVDMHDYRDFEKVGDLGFDLPESNESITTSPGDVILYLGNSVTIYYDTNTWNFTLLGKIKGMTRQSMLEFFGGKGNVTVRFSLS